MPGGRKSKERKSPRPSVEVGKDLGRSGASRGKEKGLLEMGLLLKGKGRPSNGPDSFYHKMEKRRRNEVSTIGKRLWEKTYLDQVKDSFHSAQARVHRGSGEKRRGRTRTSLILGEKPRGMAKEKKSLRGGICWGETLPYTSAATTSTREQKKNGKVKRG